ncbi:MAG TPA: hypothetical protein DIT40_08860 [Alphaproteobacteria bacterium]|nr:hypothetical protein [Alphaproteobacteria bacterium]
MSFPQIDDAHSQLVDAVQLLRKPGASPIPVTLVSVNSTDQGQLVVFDGSKWSKDEIARRLRLAADFLDEQTKPS